MPCVNIADPTVRSNTLEFLVSKRVRHLDYMRRLHESEAGMLWMNCVKINTADLARHFDRHTSQSSVTKSGWLDRWYYLGCAITELLCMPNGSVFVAALEGLLAAWERYFSNGVRKAVTRIPAHPHTHTSGGAPITSSSSTPATASGSHAASPTVVPGAQYSDPTASVQANTRERSDKRFVVATPLGFSLGYCQVVAALCSTLVFVYRKLVDPESTESLECFSKVLAIDKRLKSRFFGFLSREIDDVAGEVLRQQQHHLLNDMFAAFTHSEADLRDQIEELSARQPASGDEAVQSEDMREASDDDDDDRAMF